MLMLAILLVKPDYGSSMSVEIQPNVMDIHRAFAGTELGQELATRVRYERYKDEGVTNERWQELLGADVNNLLHMPLTRGIARAINRNLRRDQPGFLTSHEEQVLETAAIIHDWAEVIVGDITYSNKTNQDEAQERNHLHKIIEDVAQMQPQLAGLIFEAAEGVVFDDHTKLGNIFNTVERVGYMRTALRASEHIYAGTAADCETGFRWLMADVICNHVVTLVQRADQYVPVQRYLDDRADYIDRAFAVIEPTDFDNYDDVTKPVKRLAYNEALAAWAQTTSTDCQTA